MESTSGVLFGILVAFVLMPALYVAAALGVPALSGALGYAVARRMGVACVIRAGIIALCTVGMPLAVSSFAEVYLGDQGPVEGIIQSLVVSSAFLLKLPLFFFDGMYDRQIYGRHALAASAAAIFLVLWIIGAAMCMSAKGQKSVHRS